MILLRLLLAAMVIGLLFGPFAGGLFIFACLFVGLLRWVLGTNQPQPVVSGHEAPSNWQWFFAAPAVVGAAMLGFGIFGKAPEVATAGVAIMALWLVAVAAGAVLNRSKA